MPRRAGHDLIMRITLTRSGGFAGIRPPPLTLDTTALPRAVAGHIEDLVAAADFFNLPRTLTTPTPQPDRLQFMLTISNDGGAQHTVTCDEEAAPEPFMDLVRAVPKAARK
jgi:hypothetical protein